MYLIFVTNKNIHYGLRKETKSSYTRFSLISLSVLLHRNSFSAVPQALPKGLNDAAKVSLV